MYPFTGEQLVAAISATFRHRGTLIEPEPVGLSDAYYEDPARALQWRAFVRRSRFTEQPDDLKRLLLEVRQFASPILLAAAGDQTLPLDWPAGGPWEDRRRFAGVSQDA
jgi:hypothetical protein